MTTTEDEYLEKIDEAIQQAAKVMDLEDVGITDGELTDEEHFDIYEERHHCGVCEVRTVMEVVWPAVEEYIEALKNGQVDAAHA